jgi:glutaredoxin
MVSDEHICPYGIKSKWLLEREGFAVEDHHLTSRSAAEDFKRAVGVETTPQTFIRGTRIGGYDDVRRYFGKPVRKDGEERYQPVLTVFGVAALTSVAVSWAVFASFSTAALVRAVECFVALSMAMLAMLKLQDLERFSTMFVSYDLLARCWVPYSFIYPFAEAGVALLMIARELTVVSAPVALFTGAVGAISVIKTVWVDGRKVKCACVGGSSTVPLGFLSLTENVAMIAMGLWMALKPSGL